MAPASPSYAAQDVGSRTMPVPPEFLVIGVWQKMPQTISAQCVDISS